MGPPARPPARARRRAAHLPRRQKDAPSPSLAPLQTPPPAGPPGEGALAASTPLPRREVGRPRGAPRAPARLRKLSRSAGRRGRAGPSAHSTSPAPSSAQSWRTMTPAAPPPAPRPPPPRVPGSPRPAAVREGPARRTPSGGRSRRAHLLGVARPAAHGGRRHERPPRTKGRRGPEGRAWAAARGPAPRVSAPRALRGQGAGGGGVRGARGARRPRRWARSGPLRPRPPPLPHLPAAGDMFRPPPRAAPRLPPLPGPAPRAPRPAAVRRSLRRCPLARPPPPAPRFR